MTLAFHWFLPTNGDSRYLAGGGVRPGVASGDRRASLGYLSSIVRAAEEFGFTGALVPTGAWCEDAWLTAAMLARESERLAFLVAFRPGLLSPTLAAQMAATFTLHAPGRLLLNVVTGGEPHEQRAYGDHLAKDDRYARCAEFLAIVRRLWAGETVDRPRRPPARRGGAAAAAPRAGAAAVLRRLVRPGRPGRRRARRRLPHLGRAARRGGPQARVDPELAAARGRKLRFGVRLHVITRDTAEEAWRQAGRLLAALDERTVAAAQAGLARSESTGQRRMRELHERHRADGSWRDVRALEVAPNLWAGVGLVRGGAGTALVGSHAEVAERIAEYASLGIDEFILSGYPHLEELFWFGEGVLPHLARRGLFPDLGAAGGGHIPFLPDDIPAPPDGGSA